MPAGGGAAVADHDHMTESAASRNRSSSGTSDASTITHPVLGVSRDVRQLVRVQPEVERVQHRAEQRHGEVGLEVAVVVPAERGDAVAGADAERAERAREAVGAPEACRRRWSGGWCRRRAGSRRAGRRRALSARRAIGGER